ncbi:MAG: site-specific DNA-methyltransferase [Pseudomonadota bacterium]
MHTTHRLLIGDARALSGVADASVHLVVTSPPYPMIAMWDEAFSAMDPAIAPLLAAEDGAGAFERMHRCLDEVWAACHRVLVPGGLCCVNIGDATRSLGGEFSLFPNHARILMGMAALGFTVLPDILWHKPTNAPNKFMGSGMLPAGAYVTYEHEYVLVLRRGGKRTFSRPEDKAARAGSAYFWEERNGWFSDLWTDLRGTRQALAAKEERERSAAFPFDLPWRLIQMYSLYGDTVLDPFAGTGTTMAAAAVAGRSSVGVEIGPGLAPVVGRSLEAAARAGPGLVRSRLESHRDFVAARQAAGKELKHHNAPHDVPVVTGQERTLALLEPAGLRALEEGVWEVEHVPVGEAVLPGQQGLFGL